MCYNRLKCSRKIACIVVVALFFVLLAATDTVLAHWTGFDQSDANRGETISLNSWRSAVMPSQDWDDCYAIGPVYLFKTSNSKLQNTRYPGLMTEAIKCILMFTTRTPTPESGNM